MAVLPFKRRLRRVDPPEPPTVPCPRCGAPVDTYATRCRACGVHFNAPAYRFGPPVFRPGARRAWMARALVVALLAGFVFAAVLAVF